MRIADSRILWKSLEAVLVLQNTFTIRASSDSLGSWSCSRRCFFTAYSTSEANCLGK